MNASGSSTSYAAFTQDSPGTLQEAGPHSSSDTKLTSSTAKLCPLWEGTLGPVPDSLRSLHKCHL